MVAYRRKRHRITNQDQKHCGAPLLSSNSHHQGCQKTSREDTWPLFWRRKTFNLILTQRRLRVLSPDCRGRPPLTEGQGGKLTEISRKEVSFDSVASLLYNMMDCRVLNKHFERRWKRINHFTGFFFFHLSFLYRSFASETPFYP